MVLEKLREKENRSLIIEKSANVDAGKSLKNFDKQALLISGKILEKHKHAFEVLGNE